MFWITRYINVDVFQCPTFFHNLLLNLRTIWALWFKCTSDQIFCAKNVSSMSGSTKYNNKHLRHFQRRLVDVQSLSNNISHIVMSMLQSKQLYITNTCVTRSEIFFVCVKTLQKCNDLSTVLNSNCIRMWYSFNHAKQIKHFYMLKS